MAYLKTLEIAGNATDIPSGVIGTQISSEAHGIELMNVEGSAYCAASGPEGFYLVQATVFLTAEEADSADELVHVILSVNGELKNAITLRNPIGYNTFEIAAEEIPLSVCGVLYGREFLVDAWYVGNTQVTADVKITCTRLA